MQYRNNKWDIDLPANLDSESTLITCFFDPELNIESALGELRGQFKKSTIVGCSSSGEIFDDMVYDQSISAVVMQFEKAKFKISHEKIDNANDSDKVGQKLAQSLFSEDLKGVFLISDGLNVNGTELTTGINKIFSSAKNKITISGGLAGDGARFGKTFQIVKGEKLSQQVIAIGFYGAGIHMETGFFGGWEEFGPIREVSKSSGNKLFELDQKPALELYKTYLGEEAKNLPGSGLMFPLLLKQSGKGDLVRTILAVDEKDQSMTFAGDIPAGAKVQLMRANFSKLIHAAGQAGEQAFEKLKSHNQNHQSVTLAVSCVGRRLVLGQKIDDELESLRSHLPMNTDLIGFYSYGELSSDGVSTCELHNQTMTVTIISEDL